MIRVVGSSLARHMALIALFVTGVPAWAESVERVEQVERVAPGVPAGTDTALPPAAVSEQTSRPVGERLSDYETMELHLRRYGAAANSMAQLFKQLKPQCFLMIDVGLHARVAGAIRRIAVFAVAGIHQRHPVHRHQHGRIRIAC